MELKVRQMIELKAQMAEPKARQVAESTIQILDPATQKRAWINKNQADSACRRQRNG